MAESIVESSREAVLNVAKTERIRVLHVDDDYAFLKVAKQCLEMQGPFQVEMASSVEEAMEKMKKETYDAVVSDYMMPGKDGLQFLKELRQKGNSIPFIVFTGKGREEVVIKALNLGADHYENKNGNPETVYSELSHDIINAVRTRRVEQELRIQREELQVILDSMPAKIWYKDRNNRLVRVNQAFAEYMGVSKKDLEGKPLGDLFPPDIARKCWEEDKEVITTGQPKADILDRHESAQGVRWFSTGKVPCREKDGNIIGTINFSVDITERKKVEEALRKNEGRWRSLAEGSPDHIMLLDLTGNILYINRTVPDLKREEVIGTSQFDYVPPEWHRTVKDCFKRVIETGKTDHYDTEYRTKKGGVRYFDVRIGPVVQEDKVVALISSSTDVTSQKKAGEKLRESEQKFRCLVEEAAVYVGIIDLKGQLAYVNKALADSLGYSIQELEGRPFKDFLHPDDRGKIVRLFLKSILVRGKPQKLEFRVIRKDGHVLHWITKPTAYTVEDRTVGFQAIITDITERKKMEDEIRSLARFPSENPNPVLRISQDFRILFANDAGKALLEKLNWEVDGLVSAFLKNLTMKTLENQSRSGEECEVGGRIYAFYTMPIVDKGYVNVYVVDVTERRKSEQMLKESEEKYRSLVELAPDGIVAVNIEGVVTSVNRSFLTLVGYDFEEVFGKSFMDLKSSRVEDIPRFQEMFMSLMKGESPAPVEFLYVRRDGTSRWAEVHPSLLVKDGNPVGAQVIMRDITERKKVEEQLRSSEKKYHELFESSIDAIATSDMDGHFLDCNQSCQRMLGYSMDEMKKLTYQQLTPEKWHEKEAEIIEKEVMQKGYTAEYEKELIRKDGAIIPVSNRVWATFDDDGKPKTMWGIVRDITERKKTEQTLRASLERYRSFIEVTGELGWTTDSEGEVMEDVPSFRKFTGQTYEEVKGWGWSKALHPDDLERETEIWKEATRTKSKYETEYRLRRHDGIYRYFMARGVPVFEEDGNIREWVGTCIDITERKVAEDELRSSQERLKILFESAPDAYYLNDLKGNFIDGNKAAQKITGYDRNELVGKSFLKLKLLPRSQIWKAAKLLALNAAGKPTGPDEFVMTRKDGTQVPVEIRTFPVRIEGRIVVLGIARDISIRKKDQQAILESQQKFEGLFRHNPEAAVYLDLGSKVLDVNPRFCELFGYSAKEVEGKQINEVVVPEDMIEEAVMLDENAKKGYASHDTVRKRKDGSLVHVSISASPVSVEGRLLGYVGVYKDITELKNAEERLKKMNERLEITNEKLHVVGGLTRHDVRNKLSAVTGNAYLLKRKLTKDPKALEQLTDMEAAVRLVERIFEFARIYERLGVDQLASMNVGKAVNEAVSLFSDLKGIKIVNECDGLTVLADSLLNQLFYNLVDNSLKYGEKIRQIKIHYRTPSPDQLELVYEDDGVGIPDKMRSNLFREGFTSGKGTGYGLFMIKRICEVYGWTIQETGKQGKGAQFTMLIPRIGSTGKANYQIQNPRQR